MNKSIIYGALAALALLLVYFTVVSLAESYAHAIDEFLSLAYLMVPLVAGFGVQVSLFSYSRDYVKMMQQSSASVTASGGLSTASMIACCAHHITDLAPIVGITAVATFLTAYQTPLIAIGLVSNIVGITVVLSVMQKHNMYNPEGGFARIMKVDLTKVRNLTLVASVIVVAVLGWTIAMNLNSENSTDEAITLLPKASKANGLTVEVIPLPFAFGKDVGFQIKLDTHSGDLDFDLTAVSSLEDSNGILYRPKEWAGSPSGGHHREGILTFPPVLGKPTTLKLVSKGLYDVDRIFEWDLAG